MRYDVFSLKTSPKVTLIGFPTLADAKGFCEGMNGLVERIERGELSGEPYVFALTWPEEQRDVSAEAIQHLKQEYREWLSSQVAGEEDATDQTESEE